MTRIFKSPRTIREEPEPQTGRFPDLRSRPDIYPGSPEPSMSRFTISGPTGQRNRKVVRRRVSPFTVVILLLCAAVAIVLYISNIIAVDQLLNEVNSLETRHRQILMEQEILKAQINKMAGLERIQELAEKDLGLVTPTEPPGWLDVDQERIKQIEQERAER